MHLQPVPSPGRRLSYNAATQQAVAEVQRQQVLAMQRIMATPSHVDPFHDFVNALRCPKTLTAMFPSVAEMLVASVAEQARSTCGPDPRGNGLHPLEVFDA